MASIDISCGTYRKCIFPCSHPTWRGVSGELSQLIQSHYLISLISSKNNQSIFNPITFLSNSLIFVLNLDSAFIMSDEVVYHSAPKTEEYVDATTTVEPESVETSDRGLFDYFGKKDEEKKCEEAAISSEFEEKVQVSEPAPEEKKETLFEKLHRSDSSSSSSDEECDENGEKKKKKKPLKEKIKEKIEGHKEKKEEEDTSVPIEKYEVAPLQHGPTSEPEEKKGFIEKIKEKLPGGHKKAEEEHAAPPPPPAVVTHAEEGEQKGLMEKIKEKLPGGHKKVEEEHVAPPPPPAVVAHADDGEQKEKKGIFEKIKDKIPGYHSKSEEEKEKEKVKECD
ncbi:hypothetical protein L1887_16199 [Cichorium endivia]|nr:hypothetical protein L1887_16199 [Cichorium endivia]